VFTTPPDLVAVEEQIVILSSLGALLIIFVTMLIGTSMWDRRELDHSYKIRSEKEKKTRTIKSVFDKIMPDEFRQRRWYVNFIHRVRLEHTWFAAVWPAYHKERDFRAYKVSVAFTNALTFLLMNTLIMYVFYADNGDCEAFMMNGACTESTTFAGVRNSCVWRADNESCEFAVPSIDLLIVIQIACIITLVTIPLGRFMELLCKLVFGNKVTIMNKKTDWEILHNLAKVLPGSDGLEFYRRRDDELELVQIMRMKMLYAARMRKIEEWTDLVTPLNEAEKLTAMITDKLEKDPPISILTKKEKERARAIAEKK
jgi:hypothetical protein